MTKHVFIVPEPHIWDKTFKNRMDYVGEITGYLEEVKDVVSSYDGEKYVIFPGDIFHRTFTNLEGLLAAFKLFADLNAITNNHVYSVVGNHELSYRKNNPFWMLAEDYTDRFIEMRGLKGYAMVSPGIQIVDHLAVDETCFIFGHYDRTDYDLSTLPSDCKQIVFISHNSVLENEITATLNGSLQRNIQVQYLNAQPLRSDKAVPLDERMTHMFVGHMHTAYSCFDIEEDIEGRHMKFMLQYLGSLGRTSAAEVNDKDLERVIPHFVLEDKTTSYAPYKLQLKPRSEIIDEEVVSLNAEKYAAGKTMAELKRTNVFGDTPEACIERELSQFPEKLVLYHQINSDITDGNIQNLIQETGVENDEYT